MFKLTTSLRSVFYKEKPRLVTLLAVTGKLPKQEIKYGFSIVHQKLFYETK